MRSALADWSSTDAGQEALRTQFLARLDEGPEALRRDGRPSHLTASGVVVDRARTGVLLVLHRKTGVWMQPGGHVDDGDATFADAALRESAEETGLAALRLGDRRPVHLDRHPAPCGAEHHLDVRFLVVAPERTPPVVSAESLDVAWFDLDALPDRRSADLDALLRSALHRAEGPPQRPSDPGTVGGTSAVSRGDAGRSATPAGPAGW